MESKNNIIRSTGPAKGLTNAELLQLMSELSGRMVLYNTQVLHNRFWEVRKELETRITKMEEALLEAKVVMEEYADIPLSKTKTMNVVEAKEVIDEALRSITITIGL